MSEGSHHEGEASEASPSGAEASPDPRMQRRAFALRVVLSAIVYVWVLVVIGYVASTKAGPVRDRAVGTGTTWTAASDALR
jgi:hypothetical protein